MKARKTTVALLLVLFLGVALSPAALAQRGKAPSTEKVNINTATLEQLQTLPGIGPAMAKSIVDYRTKVGKFTKPEELINVKGIGEKKYLKMKDRLVV
jgi:competence protein ComEA